MPGELLLGVDLLGVEATDAPPTPPDPGVSAFVDDALVGQYLPGLTMLGGTASSTIIPPPTELQLELEPVQGGTMVGSVSLSLTPITRQGSVIYTGTALGEPGIRQASEAPGGPVLSRSPSFGW